MINEIGIIIEGLNPCCVDSSVSRALVANVLRCSNCGYEFYYTFRTSPEQLVDEWNKDNPLGIKAIDINKELISMELVSM